MRPIVASASLDVRLSQLVSQYQRYLPIYVQPLCREVPGGEGLSSIYRPFQKPRNTPIPKATGYVNSGIP